MAKKTEQILLPISPDLLEILRDPQAIQEGARHGADPGRLELVRGNWLVSADTGYKYPIRDGIPVMLIEEGARWKDTPVDALPVPPPPAVEPIAVEPRASETVTFIRPPEAVSANNSPCSYRSASRCWWPSSEVTNNPSCAVSTDTPRGTPSTSRSSGLLGFMCTSKREPSSNSTT